MVKKIDYRDKEYYYCEYCKLLYINKIWAEKCEKWCKDNQSCNIEVTKHSIKNIINKL